MRRGLGADTLRSKLFAPGLVLLLGVVVHLRALGHSLKGPDPLVRLDPLAAGACHLKNHGASTLPLHGPDGAVVGHATILGGGHPGEPGGALASGLGLAVDLTLGLRTPAGYETAQSAFFARGPNVRIWVAPTAPASCAPPSPLPASSASAPPASPSWPSALLFSADCSSRAASLRLDLPADAWGCAGLGRARGSPGVDDGAAGDSSSDTGHLAGARSSHGGEQRDWSAERKEGSREREPPLQEQEQGEQQQQQEEEHEEVVEGQRNGVLFLVVAVELASEPCSPPSLTAYARTRPMAGSGPGPDCTFVTLTATCPPGVCIAAAALLTHSPGPAEPSPALPVAAEPVAAGGLPEADAASEASSYCPDEAHMDCGDEHEPVRQDASGRARASRQTELVAAVAALAQAVASGQWSAVAAVGIATVALAVALSRGLVAAAYRPRPASPSASSCGAPDTPLLGFPHLPLLRTQPQYPATPAAAAFESSVGSSRAADSCGRTAAPSADWTGQAPALPDGWSSAPASPRGRRELSAASPTWSRGSVQGQGQGGEWAAYQRAAFTATHGAGGGSPGAMAAAAGGPGAHPPRSPGESPSRARRGSSPAPSPRRRHPNAGRGASTGPSSLALARRTASRARGGGGGSVGSGSGSCQSCPSSPRGRASCAGGRAAAGGTFRRAVPVGAASCGGGSTAVRRRDGALTEAAVVKAAAAPTALGGQGYLYADTPIGGARPDLSRSYVARGGGDGDGGSDSNPHAAAAAIPCGLSPGRIPEAADEPVDASPGGAEAAAAAADGAGPSAAARDHKEATVTAALAAATAGLAEVPRPQGLVRCETAPSRQYYTRAAPAGPAEVVGPISGPPNGPAVRTLGPRSLTSPRPGRSRLGLIPGSRPDGTPTVPSPLCRSDPVPNLRPSSDGATLNVASEAATAAAAAAKPAVLTRASAVRQQSADSSSPSPSSAPASAPAAVNPTRKAGPALWAPPPPPLCPLSTAAAAAKAVAAVSAAAAAARGLNDCGSTAALLPKVTTAAGFEVSGTSYPGLTDRRLTPTRASARRQAALRVVSEGRTIEEEGPGSARGGGGESPDREPLRDSESEREWEWEQRWRRRAAAAAPPPPVPPPPRPPPPSPVGSSGRGSWRTEEGR